MVDRSITPVMDDLSFFRGVSWSVLSGGDHQCTLLILIEFCPVLSKLFTWGSVTKTFDILPEIIIEYQI